MNDKNKKFIPKNFEAMQAARDVTKNIFENLEFMPSDFEMYPFRTASYTNLCTGCTDPRASNYDPYAEIDNNTCL